jgi:cytochrome c oxidase subunit 3
MPSARTNTAQCRHLAGRRPDHRARLSGRQIPGNHWNLAHGINGESGIFFTVYYYLTFNHLVHATWGILGILWVLARLLFDGYTAADHAGLEALASYWHATDIIWLIIFPLCYVLA